MNFTKQFKAYVLKDPRTQIPRYVGITIRSIQQRLVGHMYDVTYRPNLNKHKTAWINQLLGLNLIPIIEQIAEFDSIEEMKQFEIDYIAKYKEKYKLINQTIGGDHVGLAAHSRESILKKSNTRAVIQYNILGEKIAEYEIIEDVGRILNLRPKACSHITQCCKRTRQHAYGYIWRYKGDELGNISNIDPTSIHFNKIIQYDENGNYINSYTSYAEASRTIGDKSKGSNIRAVILGIQKTCKNYIFKLVPNYIYFNQEKLNIITPSIKKLINYKIAQYTIEDQFIQTHNSISQAAVNVYNNIHTRRYITQCCTNPSKSYKGFKWKRL